MTSTLRTVIPVSGAWATALQASRCSTDCQRSRLTRVGSSAYAGLSDPASLRYVAQVLGDAEVETRSHSLPEALGRASTQLSTTRTALAPAHALRQTNPATA
jgi:hypothetical protein